MPNKNKKKKRSKPHYGQQNKKPKKPNNNNNNNKKKKKHYKNEEKKNDDDIPEQFKNLTPLGMNVISIDDYKKNGQTYPPTIPVKTLFEKNEKQFPINELCRHPGDKNKFRWESSEKKAIENNIEWKLKLESMREGAEIHRQTRQAAQNFIKPGMSMTKICQFIESTSSRLVGYDSNKPKLRGWGFPTGCSLNECAAHYTPNPGDKIILKKKDICKIDFGVQINGYIIDCAFSMTFDPMHNQIMEAVKAATNKGIEAMGIDVRLTDIGEEIQEVMESYEATYNEKTYPIKCIRNLNGHSIKPYEIHGGKTVPIVKNGDNTKMEEGELFAIETFGSTGKGYVEQQNFDCSHFALIKEHEKPINGFNHKGASLLYKYINKRWGTIPFCRRWLELDGQKRHLMSLKHLIDDDIVRAYPPLNDIKGCYTAQYEHTIILKPTGKEVLSRGNDY